MCKFTMVNVNCRPKVPRQGPFFSITICFNVCGYCRLCRKFKRKCQYSSRNWGFTFFVKTVKVADLANYGFGAIGGGR